MPDHLVQKALYLGVGLAAYMAEKAGANLQELKSQAQKVAEELVERGEMNMEEAKRYVEDLLQEAQAGADKTPSDTASREPRRIEIVDEEEGNISTTSGSAATAPQGQNVDELRRQVEALQNELQRLRRSS